MCGGFKDPRIRQFEAFSSLVVGAMPAGIRLACDMPRGGE